jgi:hypothetical protein
MYPGVFPFRTVFIDALSSRARGMHFDRQRPLLREENNVLSVFGKIE